MFRLNGDRGSTAPLHCLIYSGANKEVAMKKLVLAGVAAATLLTTGLTVTQPANAAMRCWWNGPFRHCAWVGPYWHHHYWYRGW
jgi:hypothetical protein